MSTDWGTFGRALPAVGGADPGLEQFLDEVQRRAGIPERHETIRVVRGTFQSLKQVLPPDLLERLRGRLPGALASWLARSGATADDLIDQEVFVGPVVQALSTEGLYDQSLGGLDLYAVFTGEEASRRVRAVFSVLKGWIDDDAARAIARSLPGEVAHWFWEA